ncbi:MAG TPA: hypothetical protein VGW98_03200 [Solirubrobacteraceae bacterium]|jgi:hypothetical protein|nr:hypothetical protein [Solirubrobacteraceae bacterium]
MANSRTDAHNLRERSVSHRIPRKIQLEDFLARAFGDEWGEPVRASRLRRDGVAVGYDLLWHQGDPALHAKLSAAGAWDIVITDGGDIGSHLITP